MAKVKFDGQVVDCSKVRRVDGSDDWIMSSRQHAMRLSPGSHFRVTQDEIISMIDEIEGDAVPDAGLRDVEAAMARERETLPSVRQVIAEGRPIAHDAPNKQ